MIARERRVEPQTPTVPIPTQLPAHWAGTWWAPLLAALSVVTLILLLGFVAAPIAVVIWHD